MLLLSVVLLVVLCDDKSYLDQKDIARLEICTIDCLQHYPEVLKFVNEESLNLGGLQVMFTSEEPILTIYDVESQEPLKQIDVQTMTTEEIVEALVAEGCVYTPRKTLSSSQILSKYLSERGVGDVDSILENDPPGVLEYWWGEFYRRKNVKRALENYHKSSELGNTDALLQIAEMYYSGEATGQAPDFQEAAKYLQRAVDAGIPRAMSNLGFLHLKGRGVPPDPLRSVELFQMGAKGGDGEGALAMGMMYHRGGAVEADPEKALEYYTLAKKLFKSNPGKRKMIRNLLYLLKGNISHLSDGDVRSLNGMLDVVLPAQPVPPPEQEGVEPEEF